MYTLMHTPLPRAGRGNNVHNTMHTFMYNLHTYAQYTPLCTHLFLGQAGEEEHNVHTYAECTHLNTPLCTHLFLGQPCVDAVHALGQRVARVHVGHVEMITKVHTKNLSTSAAVSNNNYTGNV